MKTILSFLYKNTSLSFNTLLNISVIRRCYLVFIILIILWICIHWSIALP